jgi:hypothetical protein
MSLDKDKEEKEEYYQNVKDDKEDIYDCPVLCANIAVNGVAVHRKQSLKTNRSQIKMQKRIKKVVHPTNQNTG